MLKIYVAESSSFHKNESMIKCTEITDKKKLKKQLEKTYDGEKIIYMNKSITITKKTTAIKLLKDVFYTDTNKPYDGKCTAMQKNIINGIDTIAKKCINDEKQRIIKESRTVEYYKTQSEKIKQASYDNPDPISSDSESDNSLDGFVVGDDVYD